jgi:glucose/arabinose dehydrogenase
MSFRWAVAIGCLFGVLAAHTAHAQEVGRCGPRRPAYVSEPWAGDSGLWCVEEVLRDGGYGAVGFTDVVAAPDGSLWATLPLLNSLAHLTDTNADRLPDAVTLIRDDLTRPNGITYHDGALYIAGNEHLYRYGITDDALTVLADDLPFGWTGYPTGGVATADDRIYVGAGGDGACTPGRGAIYSYNMGGGDRELVAEGIRSPADLVMRDGVLWAADTVTERVFAVEAGTDYGACSGAAPPAGPAYTFIEGSAPVGLATYPYDTLPPLTDTLIVALQGVPGTVIVQGYEVMALEFDGAGVPTSEREVLPVRPRSLNVSEQKLHIQGSGFYPDHVRGVTVDGNGWVYITVGSGRVYGLRPLEAIP